MRAQVTFVTPDERRHHLGHGDLIGRLWTAALPLNDARVSEAHAMVSLRGDTLRLLGLRGRFVVDGRPTTEVELTPGLQVSLASGVHLRVEEVLLPAKVLAIVGPGLGQRVLSGVCSLVVQPRPTLVPGYQRGAAAHIWSTGARWSLQVPGQPPKRLSPGDTVSVQGLQWHFPAVALSTAAPSATRAQDGFQATLRIVAHFDSAHIHRVGEPTLALGGIPARIISELVAFGGPTAWEVIAGEIWRDVSDRHALRRKWDVNLSRLRSKLRNARVRTDLIRADGTGHFELLLHPGDQVEDRT